MDRKLLYRTDRETKAKEYFHPPIQMHKPEMDLYECT